MRFIGPDMVERRAAEVFDVGPFAFDVTRAKELIAAAPREPVDVDLEFALLMIAAGEVRIDVNRVRRVVLSEPGIAVPTPAGLMLIDGWHRALRTILTGGEQMAAYGLTDAEASQVRGFLPDRDRRADGVRMEDRCANTALQAATGHPMVD